MKPSTTVSLDYFIGEWGFAHRDPKSKSVMAQLKWILSPSLYVSQVHVPSLE